MNNATHMSVATSAAAATAADLVSKFPVRACREAVQNAVMEEVTAALLNVIVTAASGSSEGACADECERLVVWTSAGSATTTTAHAMMEARALGVRVQVDGDEFPVLDPRNRYRVPAEAVIGVGGLLPLLTPGAASLLVNIVRRFLKTDYAPGTPLAAPFGSGLEANPADSIVRVTPLGFIVKASDKDKALPWYITPKRPTLTPSNLYNALLVVCISRVPCTIRVQQLTETDGPVPWTEDPAGPAVRHGRVQCLSAGPSFLVELMPGDARLIPAGYALLPMTLSDGAMLCIGVVELFRASVHLASAAAAALPGYSQVLTMPMDAITDRRHFLDAAHRDALSRVAAVPESRASAVIAGNWPRVVGFNDHVYSMATRGLPDTGRFAGDPGMPPVQFKHRNSKLNSGMVSPFDLPYFAQVCAYQDVQSLHDDAVGASNESLNERKRQLLQRIHDCSVRVKAPQVQLHPSVAGALNGTLTIGELRECAGGELLAGCWARLLPKILSVAQPSPRSLQLPQ